MRLRDGDRRLPKYPTDPRHWHERRILATPDLEETPQAAKSGMVEVLTPDWDTYLTSCSSVTDHQYSAPASPFTTYWAATGSNIYSFIDARGVPRGSKLQQYRALGRKLLAEFSIEEEVPVPRRRLHSKAPDPQLVSVDPGETADTPVDLVWTVGGVGQFLPVSRIVESHVVHWCVLDPTSGSLIELVHSDAVEFCASSSSWWPTSQRSR